MQIAVICDYTRNWSFSNYGNGSRSYDMLNNHEFIVIIGESFPRNEKVSIVLYKLSLKLENAALF